MIIAPDRAWCCLTPPKTGSTTLTELLVRAPFHGIYTGHQHDMDPPADVPLVLASVRNPWTRVISLWKHWTRDCWEEGQFGPRLAENTDFTRFVERMLGRELEDFFAWPLDRWLRYVLVSPLRLEYLRHDLSQHLPQYDWPTITIPRLNDTDLVLYTGQPLDLPRNRELVRWWAVDDFRRFGYPREPV